MKEKIKLKSIKVKSFLTVLPKKENVMGGMPPLTDICKPNTPGGTLADCW